MKFYILIKVFGFSITINALTSMNAKKALTNVMLTVFVEITLVLTPVIAKKDIKVFTIVTNDTATRYHSRRRDQL